MSDDYDKIMEGLGIELASLTERERWSLMQAWREVFAKPYHDAFGKWTRGDYDWHVFSFEDTPCIYGDKATFEYLKQVVTMYYVIPEIHHHAAHYDAYKCTGANLPTFELAHADIHVWPADLSWTMAFTHGGHGPYFSRREWVEAGTVLRGD